MNKDSAIRALLLTTLAGVAALVVACAEVPSHEPRSSTVVPISDIHAVAGKWEGMVKETPSPPPLRYGGDWVTVTITDNDEGEEGTFEFASYRTIGVFSGRGPLRLMNGKLHSESDHGRATYTLHDQDGKPMLEVQAVDQKGVRYHAELNRTPRTAAPAR